VYKKDQPRFGCDLQRDDACDQNEKKTLPSGGGKGSTEGIQSSFHKEKTLQDIHNWAVRGSGGERGGKKKRGLIFEGRKTPKGGISIVLGREEKGTRRKRTGWQGRKKGN